MTQRAPPAARKHAHVRAMRNGRPLRRGGSALAPAARRSRRRRSCRRGSPGPGGQSLRVLPERLPGARRDVRARCAGEIGREGWRWWAAGRCVCEEMGSRRARKQMRTSMSSRASSARPKPSRHHIRPEGQRHNSRRWCHKCAIMKTHSYAGLRECTSSG